MARLNDYQHNVVSPTQASMHALSYVVPRTPSLEGIDPKDVEAGLGEYWAILRNHAGAIVLSTVAGLVLGFCIGLPFKPVYRANTMLEFLDVNGNFMNLNQADPIDSTRSSDGNLAETEARLMQSAPILK